MQSKTLRQVEKLVAARCDYDHSEIIEVPEPALSLIESMSGEQELYIMGFVSGYNSASGGSEKPVKVALLESQSYAVQEIYRIRDEHGDKFTERLEAHILCWWCGDEWAHVYGKEVVKTAEDDDYGICGSCNESTTIIIVKDTSKKYDAAFKRKVKKMFDGTTFELRFDDDDGAWDIR